MPINSLTVPNMIQGVSGQAMQVRRNTQCDSQFDMLNHAVEGATSRPGLEVLKKVTANDDNVDGFFHDIIRDEDERYTLMIDNDGLLKVTNYLTGTLCTVTTVDAAAATYLATLPGGAKGWNSFAACSADDTTFITNKTRAPAMATTRSPARDPEALFFFKAGGYLTTYTIRIFFIDTYYEWYYQTPDNSLPENAEYITTDAICYAMYNAMVNDPTNPIAEALPGLAFNIERSGNLIRLWREDGQDFSIETFDGLNQTQLIGIKGSVSGFDQLPASGFDGMVFKVQGDVTTEADDFYVEYQADHSTTSGQWVETVAPDTPIRLNDTRMPVTLINTGANTFDLKLGTWGDRIAGDGIDSAKDPSFVGRPITEIFFDQRRLGLMTIASTVWSRVNNVFSFFPDTVQAQLATAPIDVDVQAGKRIPVLRHVLQAGAETYLWADGQQFLVDHGDTTTFSAETVEVRPSTSYEWNADVAPIPVGASVIFSTLVGKYTQFTDATFQDGRPLGDTSISDHIPKYIPAGVREIVASDTLKKFIAFSSMTPNVLYFYEYRINQTDRLQSAWNQWRLPTGGTVQHISFDKDKLYVWMQRSDGLWLYQCSLQIEQEDAEGGYLTRLDMRVDEGDCTVTYDEPTNTTRVLLPYLTAVDESPHLLDTGDSAECLQLVIRQSAGDFFRGVVMVPSLITYNVGGKTRMDFAGDVSDMTFYVGLRIRSERTENVFYVHDPESAAIIYYDRLDLKEVVLSYSDLGYTRAEIIDRKGRLVSTQRYEGRSYGESTATYDTPALASGDYHVSIDRPALDCQVRFVNDTYLPASWQGLVWSYNATVRAQPGR